MNIKEATSEYPELDIYELSRHVSSFLKPYPFVQSASLYHGKEKPYHIVFETVIPEGYVEIEGPTTPKSNAERLSEFFKIDEKEAPVVLGKTMVELYAEFREKIDFPPVFCLQLNDVYRRDKARPKPLGPTPYDDRPTVEWGWGENKYDLVCGDPVCLYPLNAVKAASPPKPDIPTLPPQIGVDTPALLPPNCPDLFPELCFSTLKSYADEWAKKWPVIRKIELFRYSSFAPVQIRSVPVKYALVFDIAGEEDELTAFENATKYNHTTRDEYRDGILYEDFMAPGFENVYRQEVTKDYQKEWCIVPKRDGQEPNHFENNASWLLFELGAECLIGEQTPSEKHDIPAPIPEEKPANFFYENGEYWNIRYNGKEVPAVKNLNGILYIANILKKHGTSTSCQELYKVSGKIPDNIASVIEAIGEGLNIGNSRQTAIDAKGRDSILKKWHELKKENERLGHTPEDELIRDENNKQIEKLIAVLKDKPFADPNDKKAQANITKSLNRAYNAIGKAGLKDLAKHLRERIKSDGNYGYYYTGDTKWDIKIK